MDLQLLTSPNFDPGGRKDRDDPRDFLWSEIAGTLPPFDWSRGHSVINEIKSATAAPQGFTVPAKDQGASFSCGGQASSYYGAALESIFTQSFEERSAKFIYSQTYAVGGGSTGRDNCNLVVKEGWGLESQTSSYSDGVPPSEAFITRAKDITDVARANAKLSTALSYANTGNKIDDIAQAMQANHGVVIGITGSNNGTWVSRKPAPPKNGEKFWYHWLWVCEAGIYQGEKAVRVLNSWGPSVGEEGLQWITESYFKARINSSYGTSPIWSGWTHVFNFVPPPIEYKHLFQTNMAFGDSNYEVRALQTALTITGDFPKSIAPTGFYGNATAAAVYKFQVRMGITPPDRSHAGPKTRGELNKLFAN